MENKDNEVQEVSAITAFYSLHTCGEACWYAKEDVCHCYCAGKNHGCLKISGGISPMRMSKIDGYMYQLKGIGTYCEILGQAEAINNAKGVKRIDKVTETLTYTYYWHETDIGAPARAKPALYAHTQKWPEFNKFHGMDKRQIFQANNCSSLYCLWVKL